VKFQREKNRAKKTKGKKGRREDLRGGGKKSVTRDPGKGKKGKKEQRKRRALKEGDNYREKRGTKEKGYIQKGSGIL